MTCKMKILFKVDPIASSFFIELHYPSHDQPHEFHRPTNQDTKRLPARLLTAEQRQMIVTLNCINANAGVARNFVFQTHGETLSRHQIKWIGGFVRPF